MARWTKHRKGKLTPKMTRKVWRRGAAAIDDFIWRHMIAIRRIEFVKRYVAEIKKHFQQTLQDLAT